MQLFTLRSLREYLNVSNTLVRKRAKQAGVELKPHPKYKARLKELTREEVAKIIQEHRRRTGERIARQVTRGS